MPENLGEEFVSPFTRINRVGPDLFDVYWMRHTGWWWRLYSDVTLTEALDTIIEDELLHPL